MSSTARSVIWPASLFVMDEMERRLAPLGAGWTSVTGTQLYTVHDPHPCLADLLGARGAMAHGLTWYFARPSIAGPDYEMDCRGVMVESVR